MNQRLIGSRGEEKAKRYLEQQGYEVIDSNYLKRVGEIDIIAFDPDQKEYVFIEVKYRKNTQYGYPEEYVDDQKLDKMEQVIHLWLDEHDSLEAEWRIDVISIVGHPSNNIQHIKNV